MSTQSQPALAPEDAARLHMSVAGNPMLVTALLLLGRPIDREELELRLDARLARHRPFRQRVIEPRLGMGMPRWSEDPTFDVRHHVHRIDASLVPGGPGLEALVSDIASLPLGREHPLWRMHVVDGATPAIVMIVHHALADGAALLTLLGELADERPPNVHASVADLDETTATLAGVRRRLERIAASAVDAGRFALHRADPRTALRRARLTGRKHLAFSAEISLDRLRSSAHVHGTTVTGLLLAAVAGACREELRRPRDASLALHALVPVDVRGGGSTTLGNRYGSVLVSLPVGAPDLDTRVRLARDAVRTLRARAGGAARIAAAAGAMSAVATRLGVELFSRKASLVVSSVRGPERELHLCGAPIRDVVVWSPASGSIGTSVTLMSYAGRARVAIAVDARVSHDAGRLVHELERELERVCSSAGAQAT